MLQRYDMSMDSKSNRLIINEFAVVEQKSRRRAFFDPATEEYLFTHKTTFSGDTIREAIREGKEALIAALRSDDFFPIRPCAEVVADGVTELLKDDTGSSSEVFFDDLSLFSGNDE